MDRRCENRREVIYGQWCRRNCNRTRGHENRVQASKDHQRGCVSWYAGRHFNSDFDVRWFEISGWWAVFFSLWLAPMCSLSLGYLAIFATHHSDMPPKYAKLISAGVFFGCLAYCLYQGTFFVMVVTKVNERIGYDRLGYIVLALYVIAIAVKVASSEIKNRKHTVGAILVCGTVIVVTCGRWFGPLFQWFCESMGNTVDHAAVDVEEAC